MVRAKDNVDPDGPAWHMHPGPPPTPEPALWLWPKQWSGFDKKVVFWQKPSFSGILVKMPALALWTRARDVKMVVFRQNGGFFAKNGGFREFSSKCPPWPYGGWPGTSKLPFLAKKPLLGQKTARGRGVWGVLPRKGPGLPGPPAGGYGDSHSRLIRPALLAGDEKTLTRLHCLKPSPGYIV